MAGLRKYVGDHVHQKGSNITAERLRFDFNNDVKVERDVLDQIEAYVNEAIDSGLTVTVDNMDKQVAQDN